MKSSTQKLTVYTAIALIVLIIGAIVYVQVGRGQSGEISANGELDLSNQPSLGEEGAPVQIALFEDFKCPACGSFTQSVFPQIERELVQSGQAEVFFVNFPLPLGPDSVTAAIAAECVYEQDEAAFWDYKTSAFSRSRTRGPRVGDARTVNGYRPRIRAERGRRPAQHLHRRAAVCRPRRSGAGDGCSRWRQQHAVSFRER